MANGQGISKGRKCPAGLRLKKLAMALASLGLKYWLYVVEKALDDDYVIHRIQSPAKRANEFVYDGGWKLLSSD